MEIIAIFMNLAEPLEDISNSFNGIKVILPPHLK